MRESTRIYSRVISNLLVSGVSIAAYLRLGGMPWLLIDILRSVRGVLAQPRSFRGRRACATPDKSAYS